MEQETINNIDRTAILADPAKYGYTICKHCNGYGSSLQESALRCSKCDGLGLTKAAPDKSAAQPALTHVYVAVVGGSDGWMAAYTAATRDRARRELAEYCRSQWEDREVPLTDEEQEDIYFSIYSLNDNVVIQRYFDHVEDEYRDILLRDILR